MKVAIIGRTEILYESAEIISRSGYDIVSIFTSKEAPEYTRRVADFQTLATSLNVPFGVSSKIVNHLDLLKNAKADIAISINYTGIIPQEIINIYPLGILNLHGGDLPRYRGNACQAWAILNGESRIGLCVHKMIGGELDSGDIITREYLAIDENTKITAVLEWVKKRGPVLFLNALKLLENDPNYILEEQSKDSHLSLRCYPRLPEDGRISWNLPAINILRLINATNKPYPGAFCTYEGQKLIIWDAFIVEYSHNICAIPGQVLAIADNYVDIACGTGVLRVLSIEYSQTIMPPNALIRSIRKRLS